MDSSAGALVVRFLTADERWRLRAVSRRWHFTCAWLQQRADSDSEPTASVSSWARASDVEMMLQPRKSPLNTRSRAFRRDWQAFARSEVDKLLPEVLRHLPEADEHETLELKRGLCLSTNTGTRPSFGNASARSGYVAAKMNRCGNLPGLLLTEELADLRSKLFRFSTTRVARLWNMALYGGGPGYEAIGLAVLRRFLRADEDVSFHITVFDNEPGWEVAVDAVQLALDQMAFPEIECKFETCDITLGVLDEMNAGVREELAATQLFVFSFVCVENFLLLERSDYRFLRSLFAGAEIGSYFVFTDSTHRLWPRVVEVANASSSFSVWTPFGRGCHYALVLEKVDAYELTITRATSQSARNFHHETTQKLAVFNKHHIEQLRLMSIK